MIKDVFFVYHHVKFRYIFLKESNLKVFGVIIYSKYLVNFDV